MENPNRTLESLDRSEQLKKEEDVRNGDMTKKIVKFSLEERGRLLLGFVLPHLSVHRLILNCISNMLASGSLLHLAMPMNEGSFDWWSCFAGAMS